ncbi:hypothetical protein Ddc_15426 [Ditylenchus destructor]|nr:hypothetical protein Ddc_15426 [Ditylenchus destructor]
MSTYVPSIKRSKIDDVSQVQQSSYITATKRHLNFPTEVLLKILEWLDRNCLEKFQQICKFLNGLVVKHFPNKPYHPLYPIYPDKVELNIHPSSTGEVLDISILLYPSHNYFDPKTRAWIREYTDFSLEEMFPYLASSSVRIKHTIIYGGDVPYSNIQIAAIESLAHVWDGQELSTRRLSRTDSEILLSPLFIRCRQLEIGEMNNIPLYNNPVLYKMPVLKCMIPKNAKQLLHWIEHKPNHPESCTSLVLDNYMYSLVPNEYTHFQSEIPKFIQKVKKVG